MQAEIFDNGDFEYRYDLSRISDMDAFTNVVIGELLVAPSRHHADAAHKPVLHVAD